MANLVRTASQGHILVVRARILEGEIQAFHPLANLGPASRCCRFRVPSYPPGTSCCRSNKNQRSTIGRAITEEEFSTNPTVPEKGALQEKYLLSV
jgi:hypothetical protein